MDDIEAFSKGQFRADCVTIKLHREGSHPISVSGPGQIAQDDACNLTFKMQLGRDAVGALLNDINRPRQVGAIVPAEDYFIFTAQSKNGEVWSSSVPMVTLNMGLGDDGAASGSIYEITNTSVSPVENENDCVYLVVRDSIAFPEIEFTQTPVMRAGQVKGMSMTRNAASFTIGQEKFRLSKRESATELQCTLEKGSVGKFRHIRIQEAMMFALGQLFQPCVIQTTSAAGRQIVLRSVGMREKPAQQYPPLKFKGKAFSPEVYEIAMAYYAKIIEHTGKDWHELSSHVYFLVQAGGSAVEIQCLAIGVSAEAIAATCFPKLAPISNDFLKDIADFQSQLEKIKLSENFLKRLNGAVEAMKEARNADKLRAFVLDHGFDNRLFKSWQRLRNTAAHGSKIKDKDIVKTLASLKDVLYLCYAMILQYCAFAGVRTDYSTVGFPEFKPSV